MEQTPFHENSVVLTGASSGIGEQLAYLLAAQGAWLTLAARNVGRLQKVGDTCREIGGRALAVPTDVSDQQACQNLIEMAAAEYGCIDTLVNNAGMTMWAKFEEVSDLSIFKKLIEINYLGSVYCTYFALPYLKQNRGRIVVVSSMAGLTGIPFRSGYAASKHAMVGFFETLRIELAAYGISVTLAYPDFVSTKTRERGYGPDGLPLGKSPIQEGQVMSPETAAWVILLAASRRKREVIMSARGKLGRWLKLISPSFIDRIARRAIERGK